MSNLFVDVDGLVKARVVTEDNEKISEFLTGAVTVTSSAVELKTGASTMTGRTQLLIYPPTAGTIYWGTSGVTTANGAPLASTDEPIEFNLANDTIKVYAVSDGTNREVRVVESK